MRIRRGLYAVLDADDENHGPARDAWAEILERDASVLTTNHVLVETFALVQSRLGVPAVRTLVSDILPVVRTEWIEEQEHSGAVQALLAASRRNLSLVDCASFAAMRRTGFDEALAFDRRFSEQGFRTVPRSGTAPVEGNPRSPASEPGDGHD